MELFDEVLAYCRSNGILSLVEERKCVTVAFSGGADSSVLLHFFCYLKKKLPFLTVTCAHMNHMIRGEESDRDEEFCKRICASLNIPLTVCKRDIPSLAKEGGLGLEECARIERYAFLSNVSKESNSSLIATAHNADDNLETLIFNIARGSGTKGLTGIAPVRDGLIRPMLCCTSEKIRAAALENNIPFVVDSTNSDTAYTRNSIRHTVLPTLRSINPKACEAALRLSRSAEADCDFIEQKAKEELCLGPLTRERAKDMHPALLSRIIMEMFREKAKSTCNLSQKNISDCQRLISSPEGGSISLPFGLSFCVDRDAVRIESPEDLPCIKCTDAKEHLLPDTLVRFNSYCIYMTENEEYIKDIWQNIYKLSLHATVCCDRIYGKVSVRQRMPGDSFRLRGMTRRLKKLLCDMDVPRRERDLLPILTDDRGILAVPYIGTRDGASDNKSERAMHIFVYVPK